ncbi:hypothetical protein [Comamonas sp.]|uniref:hypothetical protein n=1 Tax=Comamonas sp. TaxID=34028 RepID=UPI00289996AF|nr:hypothetical protein [Comamonas sp.]
MVLRKPLVLKSGIPQQLPAGDAVVAPTRLVSVRMADGVTVRQVTVGSAGPAMVVLADGSSAEVVAANAAVWLLTQDPTPPDPVDLSGKLDVDFNTFTDGVTPQVTDLWPMRRGSSTFKLTVQALLTWLLGSARTWLGVQTFSAGAVIGEQSPVVKCKVIDTTMTSSTSNTDLVAHGLVQADILSASGSVLTSTGVWVGMNSSYGDAQWAFTVNATHIRALVTSASSAGVSGRPARFHIFYKG